MKKTFSRILALVLALTMLLGMAASAEPVMTTKAHSIVKWLADVTDTIVVQTTDEDGCTRVDVAISQNGAELIKGFLQLGQTLTVGTSAEEAITITPAAIEQAAQLLGAMISAQAGENGMDLEQYGAMAAFVYAAAEAYVGSEDMAADFEVISGLLANEVNRLAQVAFMMGCVQMSETGEVRIELNETAIAKLMTMYVAMLSMDTTVAPALAALKVWSYVGMAEAIEETIKQGLSQLGEVAQAMNDGLAGIENTVSFVAVIGETGLHASLTCESMALVVDYDGAAINVKYDNEMYNGNYYTHLTATITDAGNAEVKISSKDFDNEAEIYLLVGDDGAYATAKSSNPYTGTEEVVVTANAEGTIVTYTETREEIVLTSVNVVVNAAGAVADYASQSPYYADNHTVGQVIVNEEGIRLHEEKSEYGEIIITNAVLDLASMSFEFTTDNSDGSNAALKINPALFSIYAVEGSDVVDISCTAVSETEAALAASITIDGEQLIILNGTYDLPTNTLNAEADINADGETAHLVIYEKFDMETLSFVEKAETTIGNELHTAYQEGKPVITDDMYAYSFKVVEDGAEVESILVGIRLLESADPEAIHGELFLDVATDVGMEELITTSNFAVEFTVKKSNPSFIELILTSHDEVLGSISSEAAMTLEEAPAHVNGYPVSGEEIFQIIMNLVSQLAA